MTDQVKAGVVGVGSMGRNHARVYHELPGVDLVGVADADAYQAREVARSYDTDPMDAETLYEKAEMVSIAVPTRFHYEFARQAIENEVHVLVEKPFVERPEHGRILTERAKDLGVTLQVGHIERFNPAIRALADFVGDLDVIALDAMRLGPPIDRDIEVSPVLDLMIHDIDILHSIVDADVTGVSATRSKNNPYVTATIEFENDVLGTLTASRVTQRKVRTLSVTAHEAQVSVDYIDQSVEIHRQSVPEYVEQDGDLRFRRQNIVERPTVKNGEPLKAELESFVESAVSGSEPVVTGEDGLDALRIARQITDKAAVTPEAQSMEVDS